MQTDESVSRHLKNLAIFAMFAVIWLHGYPLLNSPNVANWNLRLQKFLWIDLTTWAVPTFFMMSGFFFCWSLRNGYRQFYQKKLHQCLIPYLLWCCFGATLLIPLKMLNNYRKGIFLLADTVFESGKILTCINRFFAITHHTTSVNGPLWYLRTLIVIFLFAPLFYEVCKRLPTWAICIGSILGLLVDFQIPFLCINVDHIAWFTFGIAIQKGRWLEAIHQNRMALAFIMPIVFCWLTGALMREGLLLGGKQMCLCSSRGGVNLIAFLGATSVYFLVSFDRVIPGGYRVFSNTFWFYCCHFPICMWIKSIGRVLAHENDFALLAVAILTPVLTLLGVLFLLTFFKHLTPSLVARLNGGR